MTIASDRASHRRSGVAGVDAHVRPDSPMTIQRRRWPPVGASSDGPPGPSCCPTNARPAYRPTAPDATAAFSP